MDYRPKITEGLDYLDKLCGKNSTKELRARLSKTVSQTDLFKMYQILREVIAGQTGGDAGFEFSTKDGKTMKVKNLKEAEKFAKTSCSKYGDNFSD